MPYQNAQTLPRFRVDRNRAVFQLLGVPELPGFDVCPPGDKDHLPMRVRRVRRWERRAYLGIERIRRDTAVQREVADFPRLVGDRVVQSVRANVAPETVEAVAVGCRSRAH